MSRSTTFDMQQWDKFWEYWEDFIEEWPEVKRFALLTMGSSVLKEGYARRQPQWLRGCFTSERRCGSYQRRKNHRKGHHPICRPRPCDPFPFRDGSAIYAPHKERADVCARSPVLQLGKNGRAENRP